MEAIITDIQDRIKTQVAPIKYVDEDWGQLDYYTPNFPTKFPCVLIDITNIQWDNYGNKKQIGVAQIQLKIADLRLSNSSNSAPAGQKNKSNSFYTLTQIIYQALQGWTNDKTLYKALIRVSERRLQRDDGVKVVVMNFSTEITDISAATAYATVSAPTVSFNTEMVPPNGSLSE